MHFIIAAARACQRRGRISLRVIHWGSLPLLLTAGAAVALVSHDAPNWRPTHVSTIKVLATRSPRSKTISGPVLHPSAAHHTSGHGQTRRFLAQSVVNSPTVSAFAVAPVTPAPTPGVVNPDSTSALEARLSGLQQENAAQQVSQQGPMQQQGVLQPGSAGAVSNARLAEIRLVSQKLHYLKRRAFPNDAIDPQTYLRGIATLSAMPSIRTARLPVSSTSSAQPSNPSSAPPLPPAPGGWGTIHMVPSTVQGVQTTLSMPGASRGFTPSLSRRESQNERFQPASIPAGDHARRALDLPSPITTDPTNPTAGNWQYVGPLHA